MRICIYRTGAYGALSSGFNSAPPSPAATSGGVGGGSAFDLGNFENTQPFTIARCIKIGILMLFFVTISVSLYKRYKSC